MAQTEGSFEVNSDLERIQFDTVHSWLSASYWSPGIARDKVERAARNSSLVVGAYVEGEQAGYLRIISDRETFAWVCDVIVGERFRGRGIGKAMVRFAMAHPDHQGLRRWVLATRDAHDIYAACGFEPVPEPKRWMIYHPPK